MAPALWVLIAMVLYSQYGTIRTTLGFVGTTSLLACSVYLVSPLSIPMFPFTKGHNPNNRRTPGEPWSNSLYTAKSPVKKEAIESPCKEF